MGTTDSSRTPNRMFSGDAYTGSTGDLDERVLLSSFKQPLSWFRFIYDVDMKWIHSDKALDEFFEHAISIHPSKKFTHEVSKTKISFLDTTVMKHTLY